MASEVLGQIYRYRVSTDTSYSSPNLSVQLTYNSYDTNKLDHTQNGKHEKYGSKISYVLADTMWEILPVFRPASHRICTE